jgi:hypothetical protein
VVKPILIQLSVKKFECKEEFYTMIVKSWMKSKRVCRFKDYIIMK